MFNVNNFTASEISFGQLECIPAVCNAGMSADAESWTARIWPEQEHFLFCIYNSAGREVSDSEELDSCIECLIDAFGDEIQVSGGAAYSIRRSAPGIASA